MLGKKLVTSQKRGEPRAACLGFGMVACSMIMYCFILIVIVPLYRRSVWTKRGLCKVMNTSIYENVHYPFIEDSEENTFHYPCLEVQVNLTPLGQVVMLYHTEKTVYKNPKCSYIPPDGEDYREAQKCVESIRDMLRKQPTFDCHYDPSREEKSAIFERLYRPEHINCAFIWSTLMLIGGALIVILVKLNQYVAVLSTSQKRIGR
ncbi:calcium-activated potassium channel subunit beta-1 [Hemicordylus capensis]|uniref:calcium-activated potassium channel subunit beta-1 n=1 Tax=Hemicordylus capensis TaxID=884348 RepID=UPI00230395AE|nr:calcium-activated potassium channel subunit beta-1 [Hemicordylus capensis]